MADPAVGCQCRCGDSGKHFAVEQGMAITPLFFTGLALLVVYCLLLLRAALQRDMSGALSARVWRQRLGQCLGCLRACVTCTSASGEPDDVKAYIDSCMQAKVEAKMAAGLKYSKPLAALCVVTILVNLLSSTNRLMSIEQVIVFFVAFACSLVSSIYEPAALSRRSGLLYSALMAVLCSWLGACFKAPIPMLLTQAVATIFRIQLALLCHRPGLVFAWNAVFSLVSVYVGRLSFAEGSERGILLVQSWATLVVLGLCWGAAAATRAEVRRDLEASELRGESSGLWKLLDMVCDVVVPVDESLRIADAAARFSALVMRQGRDLKGTLLQEFMPAPEDSQAFENCVRALTSEADSLLPRVVHVKLRDSMGGLIRVELFCVAVQTPVRTSYFIGVREVIDGGPIVECNNFAASLVTSEVPAQEDGDFSGDKCSSIASSRSSGSRSSRGSRGSRGRRGRRARSLWRPPLPQAHAEPDLPPTSYEGLDLALVRVMARCSAPLGVDPAGEADGPMRREGQCCPFHRRVDRLHMRLRHLSDLACLPEFRPEYIAQCQSCGFLAARAEAAARPSMPCFACEALVELPKLVPL